MGTLTLGCIMLIDFNTAITLAEPWEYTADEIEASTENCEYCKTLYQLLYIVQGSLQSTVCLVSIDAVC